MSHEYSAYQKAIISDIHNGSGNVAVNAVAGSGKTYTICEGVKEISGVYNVLMAAFGRDIAGELQKRDLPRHVQIHTYNAFGWGIARRCCKYGKLVLNKTKTQELLQHKILHAHPSDQESMKQFFKFKNSIIRLVSLLKGEIVTDMAQVPGKIMELAEHHAMDLPDDKNFPDAAIETYRASINNEFIYDYDDQIFQVLYRDMPVPSFDYVYVDEFQDTNDMQSVLMQKASRNGRFFGVGDPDQAIYGFRGATPDAFGKFVKDFKARELPLSICYRCPTSVVEAAKLIVPRIEAAPGAKRGSVDSIATADFKSRVRPGDYVLCRTMAPLVKQCLGLIREGTPARIFGRDLGDDLGYIIERISQGNEWMPINFFVDSMKEYVQRKMEAYALMKNENLALALEDKALTIQALMEGCKVVKDLHTKIKEIFTDDKGFVVLFMTVHKSKGLEAKQQCYVLRPDLIPHPRSKAPWMVEEERRLKYVATTRATDGLYWVQKEQGEK